jgi:hypothetical protein
MRSIILEFHWKVNALIAFMIGAGPEPDPKPELEQKHGKHGSAGSTGSTGSTGITGTVIKGKKGIDCESAAGYNF